MPDTVVAASDHAGVQLRLEALRVAKELGFAVEDLGPAAGERVDYPDFARAACQAVTSGRARFAILVCGTGIGMSMAANKVKGIRAALCGTELEARLTRAHNDANVLCLGGRVLGLELGAAVVAAFLQGGFEGGRHQQRIDKVMALER